MSVRRIKAVRALLRAFHELTVEADWQHFSGTPHLISLVQLLNFCQSDIRIWKIFESVHLNKLNF